MNNKKSTMQDVKRELGEWIFSIMANMSKDQFNQTVSQMETSPNLVSFKKRVDNARVLYQQACQMCTENEAPYAAKSFFYGIKYRQPVEEDQMQDSGLVGQADQSEGGVLTLDLGSGGEKEALVTGRINNRRDFGAFDESIAKVLANNDKHKQAMQELDSEEEVVRDVLKMEAQQIKEKIFESPTNPLQESPTKSMTMTELLNKTLSDDEDTNEMEMKRKELAAQSIYLSPGTKEAMQAELVKQQLTNNGQLSFQKAEKKAKEAVSKGYMTGRHGKH